MATPTSRRTGRQSNMGRKWVSQAGRSLKFILVAAVRYAHHDPGVCWPRAIHIVAGAVSRWSEFADIVCVWLQEGSEVTAMRVSGPSLHEGPNSSSRSVKPAGASFGFRKTASILLRCLGINSFSMGML
jgi:hypothetical protein